MKDLIEFYGILMTLCLAAHENPDKKATAMRNCAKTMLRNGGYSVKMTNFLHSMSNPLAVPDPVGHYLLAVRKVSEITEDSPLSL